MEQKNKNISSRYSAVRNPAGYIVRAAAIAALYAALTAVLWEFSAFAIQLRLSEALCVLTAFTPAAVPGLYIGCLIANLFGGSWADIIFGSLATLAAAVCGRFIAKRFGAGTSEFKYTPAACILVPLPTVLFNALVIPFVLFFGYGLTTFGGVSGAAVLGIYAFSVGAGEAIVCYAIGVPLMLMLSKLNGKSRFL
ncbi:MAG: QueT transporter family protein [Clostridiales bacterium]|nr:QueT transporter family protein [Clostridiales bacterium]